MQAVLLTLLVIALTPPEIQGLVDAGRLDEAKAAALELPESQRAPLLGQIAMKREDWPAAVAAFEQTARDLEEPPPELFLYLAVSYLRADRPTDSVRAAERASALSDRLIALPLVEARARRAIDDDSGAYRVLERAIRAFPEAAQVRLELVALLEAKGLSHAAIRAAAAMTSMTLDGPTRLALLDLLYDERGARAVLERLAATAPKDPDTVAHLAYHYAATGENLAAGRLFERAWHQGGDFAFEAADQYRVAGLAEDALAINAQVSDPQRRASQRLAILFESGRYARVVAMASQVTSFTEPGLVYRVAYAHYALGDYAEATRLAQALETTTYRDSGRALLQAMGVP